MSLSEKVKTIRLARKWTQGQVALRAGWPGETGRSYVKAIESGAIKKPPPNKLRDLAKGLAIPAIELFTEVGYVMPEAGKGNNRPETSMEILERLKLSMPVAYPIYEEFNPHLGAEHSQIVGYIYRVKTKETSDNISAFIVHGNCMMPRIENGDVVVVDSDRIAQSGNVLICLEGDEVVCGRYEFVNGEHYLTNSEERVKLTDCKFCAVVIEVIKRLG